MHSPRSIYESAPVPRSDTYCVTNGYDHRSLPFPVHGKSDQVGIFGEQDDDGRIIPARDMSKGPGSLCVTLSCGGTKGVGRKTMRDLPGSLSCCRCLPCGPPCIGGAHAPEPVEIERELLKRAKR